MDIAIENHWLVEKSVLCALPIDTLTSLKKEEEEFAKQRKLTKNKQKPHPKGMRYNPLVIKRSCMIASKCHKKGYEVVWSILLIPSWETTEGNHRLWVAIQEGIPFIPCRVIPHWPQWLLQKAWNWFFHFKIWGNNTSCTIGIDCCTDWFQ